MNLIFTSDDYFLEIETKLYISCSIFPPIFLRIGWHFVMSILENVQQP